MGKASIVRPLAALTGLIGAGVGVVALVDWQRAGWDRAAFSLDYGGPVAPLAAFLFVALGVSGVALSIAGRGRLVRQGVGAVSILALGLMLAVTIRGNFRSPDFVEWKSGPPEFWGIMPVGSMSAVAVMGFVLTALGFLDLLRVFARLRALEGVISLSPLLAAGLSVLVLFAYASGPPLASGERPIPIALPGAVAFLAINSSLLLLGLWPRLRVIWESAGTADERPARSASFSRLGIAVIAVGVLMTLTGLLSLRRAQTSASLAAREQLAAIAELKAAQVGAWRSEREREGRLLIRAAGVAGDIRNLVSRPDDARFRAKVLGWLEPIRAGERYESARVFNARGELLLSSPPDPLQENPLPPRSFGTALRGNDVLFTDPQPGPSPDSWADFNLIVPVRTGGGEDARAGAAIVLNIDPGIALFPLLLEWPGPSPTGEVLLMRREGDGVVYLSQLRTPLAANQRRGPVPPDAAASSGFYPVRDYRGVMAFAVARPVPNSPWILEAKMDQAEAYARVRSEALRSGALVSLLVLSVVLAAAFAWRERQAGFLERALEAERRGSTLAQRLALITENANDVILLFDASMRIVEVNERVRSLYGWPPEEMRGMTLEELHPPETRPGAPAIFQRIFRGEGEGGLFETRHLKRDGTLLPVEVSARPVSIGETRYQLVMVRDITQRRAHEAEIQRLNRLYAALSQVNEAIVRAATRDEFLNDVCHSLVNHGGFAMAWVAWRQPETGEVAPVAERGDRASHLENLAALSRSAGIPFGTAGQAILTNHPFACADHLDDPSVRLWHQELARAGFSSALSVPVRRSGSAVGALTVYTNEAGSFGPLEIALLEKAATDIAFGIENLDAQQRRREAESALKESEERLRLALSAAQQGLFDLDLVTGRAIVTPEYATMLGFDPGVFEESNDAWRERLHPEDRPGATAAFRDYIAGRRADYRVEFRQRTSAGGYKWILSVGRIVAREADGTPLRLLGTHTDITDRKDYEATILATQNRLAGTLDAIPDLLFEMGLDGRYYSSHSPSPDLLVAPEAELAGKSVLEVMPKEAAEGVLASLREAAVSGRSLGRQIELPLAGGSTWFELSVARAPRTPGEAPRFVVLSRDINARKRTEEALRASLHEKEALLREVHHRVKNNLQVITSLLRLETSRSGDDGTRLVLRDMQGRIRSMALLHETLYRSGNFAQVDLGDYLRQLATQLFRGQNTDPARITLALDLARVSLSIDQAIPSGLIVNELLTNSLKYAFPEERGEVRVALDLAPGSLIRLTVSDTGRGLPPDFESRRTASLGLQLVADLARQLMGSLDIHPKPATFTITFPSEPHRQTAELPGPL